MASQREDSSTRAPTAPPPFSTITIDHEYYLYICMTRAERTARATTREARRPTDGTPTQQRSSGLGRTGDRGPS